MVTLKRVYVFATCIISGIAGLFTIISLATEEWIVTDSAIWIGDPDVPNKIKYGLFEGTFTKRLPTTITLQISMTCLMKENVCAVLCAGSSDARYELLRRINDGTETSPDDDINCPAVSLVNSVPRRFSTRLHNNSTDTKKFINCGVWVSTIFFLVLSLFFGLISSAMSMYNVVTNPVQVFLSITGLYIYNGIAMGCCLMAMVLWGIMHIIITYHNIAIRPTLLGMMTSDKRASLGYSYWINIISVAFYFGSICILYTRQMILSKDPGYKIEKQVENASPDGLYLY
ncbi:uncharacterized protein [Leptinotarsa decemlineata]|uniref:uncharacterized protein n=1 Tax=Leptinotarsa decemlineata TaxID=7539 RepID=UPI003D3095F8